MERIIKKKREREKKVHFLAMGENVIWGYFSKHGNYRVDFYNYF